MPFTFDSSQIAQIDSLSGQGEDRRALYNYLIKEIDQVPNALNDPDVAIVFRFLLGARQINSDIGPFSVMIRGYTERQRLLRTGVTGNIQDDLQNASNAIADSIAQEIVLNNGALPPIQTIANADASRAVITFFEGLAETDTAGDSEVAAGWAGVPFFADLGSKEQLNRLLTAGTEEVLDTLDDLKNVLFAFDSMAFGIRSLDSVPNFLARLSESVVDDPRVVVGAFPTFRKILFDYSSNIGDGAFSREAAGAALVEFSRGTVLADPFEQITRLGQDRLLDDIRSSWNGTFESDTTDSNFLAQVLAFFGSIDVAPQQNTDIDLLAGQRWQDIANSAVSSEAVRNALKYLSTVSIGLSDFSGRELDLYDDLSGDGSLSSRWMNDRAKMLVARQLFDQFDLAYNDTFIDPATFGERLAVVVGSKLDPDTIFTDLENNITLDLGGDIFDDTYVVFGSDGDDVVSSSDVGNADDSVFGNKGNDELLGGEGDDYLEGGHGADELYGEDGNDLLVGGEGDDYLEAGKGSFDRAEGGVGDDLYVFNSGDQFLRIFDADDVGSVEVRDTNLGTYRLNDQTISEVPGSPNNFMDELGNTYELFAGQLFVTLTSGDGIQIEAFSSGDLGIVLGPENPFDVPVVQPGAREYAVDPNNIPTGTEEEVGRYQLSGSPPQWISFGAIAGDSVPEIISAVSLGDITTPNTYYEIHGGLGDSIITGDDGFNVFYDDSATIEHLDLLGVVYGDDVLDGADGVDWLFSTYGNDWLIGGDDDSPDLLIDNPDPDWGGTQWIAEAGNSSDDHMFGGGGDDYLISNGGNDFLDGGTGNDGAFAGAGDDTLLGGDGNDTLSGDTRLTQNPILVSGSPGSLVYHFDGDFFDGEHSAYGNDTLIGGSGADTLFGGGGNDRLSGGDDNDHLQGDFMLAPLTLPHGLQDHSADPGAIHGNDTLNGGDGDDIAYGGGADDVIYGDAGNDFLYGDWDEDNSTYVLDSQFHGDDIVVGGLGNDVIFGNGGNDTLEGNEDDDFLYGGDGDDVLHGGAGIDQLVGDAGNDLLFGGAGNDVLFGMEGNNQLLGEEGDDQLVGGEGEDVLRGGAGDDSLFGGEDDDLLEGSAGQDELQGGGGSDVIVGGAGNDLLFGGSGDDTYQVGPGSGQDQITDSEGSSTIVFEGVTLSDVSVSIENGLYFIDYTASDYLFMDADTFNAIDSVQFSGGTTFDANALLHEFEPSSADGTQIWLTGDASTDDLILFAHNDDLVLAYTGSVSDWIDTSGYSDRDILVQEGDARDFGFPDNAPAILLTNWYRATSGAYVNFIRDEADGFINLFIDAPTQLMFQGGAGQDTFVGTPEAEVFIGGDGQDVIDAGDGDDQLIGGRGADLLIGGAGDDSYTYNLGDGADMIQDASGNDVLNFGPGIAVSDLTIALQVDGLRLGVGPEVNADSILIFGWVESDDNFVESFSFDDGTVLTAAEVEDLVEGNRRPLVAVEIPDQELDFDELFSFSVPPSTFDDPDGDDLAYTAGQADGSPLPEWLSFDSLTQTFSGAAPSMADAATYEVSVTATDPEGLLVRDTFTLNVGLNALFGTPGDDVLIGDELDNNIIGNEGDDQLFGEGGNDFLRGDAGRDELFGGEGDDLLDSGAGGGRLEGGAGDDILIGGDGGEVLLGGDGNDHLIGGPGNDRMDGGAGQNVYDVNLGGDRDILTVGAPGTHTVRFGPGIQRSDITASFAQTGSTFDLSIAYNPGDAADFLLLEDLFSRWPGGNIQSRIAAFVDNYAFEFDDGTTATLNEIISDALVGTDGPDELFHNDQNDPIFAGDGDDIVWGRQLPYPHESSNTSFGEGGNDQIWGGNGDDFLSGGDGDDDLMGDIGDDTLVGGAGDDLLVGNAGNDSLDGGEGNDQILAHDGDDILMGGGGADQLSGYDGRDQIFGGDGDDTISGGAHADFIEGGAGDDTISAGTGAIDAWDVVRGGTGNDRFENSTGGTRYLYDAGDGHDIISDTGHVHVIVNQVEYIVVDQFEFVDGSGIQLSDLQVTRIGDNLVLTVTSTDSITFEGWFLSDDNKIEEFITYDDLGNQIVNSAADVESLIDAVNSVQILDNLTSLDQFRTDPVLIGSGVTGSQLTFNRANDDRLIAARDPSDAISIQGSFIDSAQAIDFIATTRDGVVLTARDINALTGGGAAQSASSKATSSVDSVNDTVTSNDADMPADPDDLTRSSGHGLWRGTSPGTYRIEEFDVDCFVRGNQQFNYRATNCCPRLGANADSTIGVDRSEYPDPRKSGPKLSFPSLDNSDDSPSDISGRLADRASFKVGLMGSQSNGRVADIEFGNVDRTVDQFVAHIAALNDPRSLGIERLQPPEEFDNAWPRIAMPGGF